MMVNSIISVSFTPIGSQVLKFYNINVYELNSIFIIDLVFYIAFTIPSNIIIDKYGSHWSIFFGSIFTLLGVLIRCLIN